MLTRLTFLRLASYRLERFSFLPLTSRLLPPLNKKTATTNCLAVSITTHIVYDKRHAPSISTADMHIPIIALPSVSKSVTWAEPFRNVGCSIIIFMIQFMSLFTVSGSKNRGFHKLCQVLALFHAYKRSHSSRLI